MPVKLTSIRLGAGPGAAVGRARAAPQQDAARGNAGVPLPPGVRRRTTMDSTLFGFPYLRDGCVLWLPFWGSGGDDERATRGRLSTTR
jgi:hypothetical protein